ncbi:hypothetical protein IKH83_01215 [Candidatus Saccharibacteria bacterium]|nr:hypothetical protein [Candidatus Saccharibacteria bacterium]
MVTVRLIRAGLSEIEATTLAVLHDIGKKYTAGTNKHGEACFYGHAAMGAILTAIQARCLPWFTTTWEHRTAVGLVYGHTFPYSEWPGHPGKKEEYFLELVELFRGEASFANRTMQLIEIFNTADIGCKTSEELAEARKPGGIIEEGWALLMSK